jgi:uridine kinase
MLEQLKTVILWQKTPHPLRVGIDGVDAAGKTTLAEELATLLRAADRPVIRVSIDGFHHPKHIRYQQGRFSPQGYYADTTDYDALLKYVLRPLGPGGNLQYKTAVFDFVEDAAIEMPFHMAEPDSILLLDGVFLLRPALFPHWDLTIFVDIDEETSVQRATKRDGYYLGNEAEIVDMYRRRYVPGQRLYFAEASPKEKADIIVQNECVENPEITFRMDIIPGSQRPFPETPAPISDTHAY